MAFWEAVELVEEFVEEHPVLDPFFQVNCDSPTVIYITTWDVKLEVLDQRLGSVDYNAKEYPIYK